MKKSAGILVYRHKNSLFEVFLVHPGGPFWAKKDEAAWSIPKGEFSNDEEPLAAAKREFNEEIGQAAPNGQYIELGSVKVPGKNIFIWAVEADVDAKNIVSNTIGIEWPPRSGQKMTISEVDKAQWFNITDAFQKLHKGQNVFLERLAEKLNYSLTKPEQTTLI